MGSMSVGLAETNSNTSLANSNVADGVRYRIARPEVAEQLMDGELVIINFTSGKYHGVCGSGVAIWQFLDAGCSTLEIVEALRGVAGQWDAELESQVFAFIAELERQALICRDQERSTHPPPALGMPFELPQIDTLDDMQDYLALDPIHDVDERGWPCKKDQG